MIGNNEEAKIGVKLDLDLSNVDSAFGKIQKEITSLGTKAELTMAKLNPKSDMYKSLLWDYEKIHSIQNKISNIRQNDKSLTTANVELRQQLLWLESIKARMSDNIKFAQNNIFTQKAQTKEFQNQTAELTRLTDKFGGLNREAQSLKNHYKSLGDKTALGGLAERLKEIQQQQTIISNLSSKKNAGGILSSVEIAQLDNANIKYKELRTQVADLKVKLNDVPTSNLILDAGKRAIGYSALFTGITLVTGAIGALVKTALEGDLALRTLGAVLDTSLAKAQQLGGAVRELGATYGGTLKDIDSVALALARAGISQDKLVKSTEIVLQLARLTGDTFEISANAMITYQQVYGNTKSLEELGNILAYVANKSRLSTEDIGTFSNYVLSTAKSMGVTVNAVSGLATAFSVAGVNASTIGTQLRTFFLGLSDDSKAMRAFYDAIGVNQKNLLADIQRGGETSDKAILMLIKRMGELDTTEFNQVTGQMEKLTGTAFKTVRENRDNSIKMIEDIRQGVTGQLDNTKMILESYLVTFQSMWNNFLNQAPKAVSTVENALTILSTVPTNTMSLMNFDLDEAKVKLAVLSLKDINFEIETLKSNYDKGYISTESFLKSFNALTDKQKGFNKALKDSATSSLKDIDTSISKKDKEIAYYEQQLKLNENNGRTLELLNKAESERVELIKEQTKYKSIVNDTSKKDNTTEELDKNLAKIKELGIEASKEKDTESEKYKNIIKLIDTYTDKVREVKSTENESLNISLIPEGDNEKLVTYLTQQVNALKEAKKDFSQEQALLNQILAQDNQKALQGTQTVIKQAKDLNSDFGNQLVDVMGKSVTEALSLLNTWQTTLKMTQSSLSADLNLLESSGKGDSSEADALREKISLTTKQSNIIKEAEAQQIKIGEIQTKNIKVNQEGAKKEVESIYSILNARKEEALTLQKIEQYKLGLEGTAKGNLEVAKTELEYAKMNLDEALKRKENEKDIAKFKRDKAEAELAYTKAQDIVTNKMLEQKAIQNSFNTKSQVFNLGLDGSIKGNLLDIENRIKSINEQIIQGKQNEEQLQKLNNDLKDVELEKAKALLELEKEKIRLRTEDGVRAIEMQTAELENMKSLIDSFGSISDKGIQGALDLSKVLNQNNSTQLEYEKTLISISGKYEEDFKQFKNNPIELARIQKNYQDDISKANKKSETDQIVGYANIAGAMSNMFEEGSRGAEVFRLAQMAIVTVNGINAILSAGMAPPPFGLASMVAMGGMVAGLVSQLGVTIKSFSGNKVTESYDKFALMVKNEGKGTVLGDSDQASQSLINSMDILKEFAQPQYKTLLSMNRYLANISNNIGGVSTMIFRQSGFALGQGFTPYDSGYKNNISGTQQTIGGLALNAGVGGAMGLTSVLQGVLGSNALLTPVGGTIASSLTGAGLSSALSGALVGTGIGIVTTLLDKFVLGGAISNLVGKVIGGIFGKTSVSMSLADSGIMFADQLLVNAKEDFQSSAYQVIAKTTSKKSWFSSSSSTEYMTFFSDMFAGVNKQFADILSNIYNTALVSAEALDLSSSEVMDKLDSFVVSIGKVSLKGKSGEEVSKILTEVFSKVSDELVSYTFLAIDQFQKVGEGLFETLTRVATGMEEAEFYIAKLGKGFLDLSYFDILNKQGDVGFNALLQSIVKADEAMFGFSNNLVGIITKLNGTAEELYQAYIALDTVRFTLMYLGKEADSLSSSMIFGAGSIDVLAGGLNSYIENFMTDSEQLSYQTSLLEKEFNKLNLAVPNGKEGFKELIGMIDLTTQSGQELYGRLMSLTEAFVKVSDDVAKSIETLQENFKNMMQTNFDDFENTANKMFQILQDNISKTQAVIDKLLSSSNPDTLVSSLIKYNKAYADYMKNGSQENLDAVLKFAEISSGLGANNPKIADELKKLQDSLTKEQEVIKVDIVDGLGTLLGLNESQVKELQGISSDGKITIQEIESIGRLTDSQLNEIKGVGTAIDGGILVTDTQIKNLTSINEDQRNALYRANIDGIITNDELSNINGLTQVQKDGILQFAEKSNYFSTEGTLSTLQILMKKQLEVMQNAKDAESQTLSSQTFKYGDYVGMQEQIDITKTLGASYDTVKPLIEKLQGIGALSGDALASEVKKLIGFTDGGLSYNTNLVSQIGKLAPYLNQNIIDVVNSAISSTSINKGSEVVKLQEEIKKLEAQLAPTESNIRAKYSPTIESLKREIAQLELLKYGQSGETQAYIGVNQQGLQAKISNTEYAMNQELGSVLGGIKGKINEYAQTINSLNATPLVNPIINIPTVGGINTTQTANSANLKMIADIYANVFKKQADVSGLQYWSGLLDSGRLNSSNIISNMATSAYSQGLITKQRFIEIFYEKGLGKTVDSAGLSYWMSQNINPNDFYSTMSYSALQLGAKVVPFADGGIVTRPTNALIGEAGYPEAVIPLKNPNDPLNMQEVVDELKMIRKENEDMKLLMVKLTADNSKMLTLERANYEK